MEYKEKILNKLKEWLKTTNVITADQSDFYNSLGWQNGFKVDDKKTVTLRDGKTQKEVYVVSFKTIDIVDYNEKGEIVSLMEGMFCYAYFDAETLDLMYIHKKTGYIEKDGSY